MRGIAAKELARLVDPHLEHVGDRLAFIFDLERLRVVALAFADLARHVDVGQEVHLDLDDAVALTGLAAAALDVEREAARPVAAHLRIGHEREQLADEIERAGVRRRIRARRASDRRLIDDDELVERLGAASRVPYVPPAGWPCRCWLSALTITSLTSVDLPLPLTPVTQANTPSGKSTSRPWMLLAFAFLTRSHERGVRRCERDRDELPPSRYAPVSDAGLRDDSSSGPTVRMRAALGAGARADVDDHVGLAHRVLVVLDHDQRVAEVAQRLQRREQPVVVALMQARSTVRPRCRARRPASEPICVARRMRCDSPPESVVALRARLRYPSPTLARKPSRARISLRI